MSNLLDSWKAWAMGDAERRGLPGLKPILEGLAASTSRLRATDWQPHQPDRPARPDRPAGPARPEGPARPDGPAGPDGPARPDNV